MLNTVILKGSMRDRKSLEQNFTKAIRETGVHEGFIKITDNPVGGLSSEQKVVLNRKANIMFNSGNIEDARRIFITTGYSDGLTRVGDYYMNSNKSLDALKAYYLAHNKRDAEPIYEDIAQIISTLLGK